LHSGDRQGVVPRTHCKWHRTSVLCLLQVF